MHTAIFGGTFNPPHIGHVRAVRAALDTLRPDRLMVIPTAYPPHKEKLGGGPNDKARLRMTELAFMDIEKTVVSDLEIKRGGLSYTVDTLRELRKRNPEDEFFLLVGTDMLLSFETWKDFKEIFNLATLAVFPRGGGQKKHIAHMSDQLCREYGAKIVFVDFDPIDISSSELRELLADRRGLELLPQSVYEEIIRNRYYEARPNLSWLREKVYPYMDSRRVGHVMGVEKEANSLAERWGADPEVAAEAAILHDITKRLDGTEQLKLCEKYGIITDNDEKSNYKLLHAKTGAALSRELFGIPDDVYNAVLWHTTGREDMTLLEKVIYMADYIEPNRHFDGVDKLRKLAYENLDEALILGLEMSIDELKTRDILPHQNSQKALTWLLEHK